MEERERGGGFWRESLARIIARVLGGLMVERENKKKKQKQKKKSRRRVEFYGRQLRI